MPLGARVWKIGKVLVLAGALAVTFLAAFGISMRMALRASEVSVPSLSGVTINDASAVLADLGLTLQVDEDARADARVPAGRIMQQDPPPGTRARRQRSVRVWVSRGPRAIRVPRLVGQSQRTARIRLEQDSLDLTATSEVHSSDYPPDSIIAQSPDANVESARVRLLVSRGEPATVYVMPNVVGTVGEDAAAALRDGGLRVAVVATQPVVDTPAGTVTRQDPVAGSKISTTDIVSLEVSR